MLSSELGRKNESVWTKIISEKVLNVHLDRDAEERNRQRSDPEKRKEVLQ